MTSIQKEVPEVTGVESADVAAGLQMPLADGSGLFMIPEPEETNETDLKMPRPKLSVCDHFSLYEQLLQIKRSAIELRSALEHGAVNAEASCSGVSPMDTMQQLNALAMRTLNEDSDSSTAAGSNPSEQLIVDVARRLREEQKRLTELQQLIEMTTETTPNMQALGLTSGPLATLVEAPEHINSPTRASPELVKADSSPRKVDETPEIAAASPPTASPISEEGVVAGAEAAAGGTLRAKLAADGTLGVQPVTAESITQGSIRAAVSGESVGSTCVAVSGEGTALRRMPSLGEVKMGPGRMQSSGSTSGVRVAGSSLTAPVELEGIATEPLKTPVASVPSPLLQTRCTSTRNLPPSVRQSTYAGAMAGAMRQGSLPVPRSPVAIPRSPRLSLGRDSLLRPGSSSLPFCRDGSLPTSPLLQPGDRGPPRGRPAGTAHIRADSSEHIPPVVAALQGVPFASSNRQSLQGPARASSRDPAALAVALQAAVETAAQNSQMQPTVIEGSNRLGAAAPSRLSPPPSVPVTPQVTMRDTRMQAVLRVRQPRNSLKVSPTPRNSMLQAAPIGQAGTPGSAAPLEPLSYENSDTSSITSSSKGGSYAYPSGPSKTTLRAKAQAYPVRTQVSPTREQRGILSPHRGRPMTPSNPETGATNRIASNPRLSFKVASMRGSSPTGLQGVATIMVPSTPEVVDPSTGGVSITVSAPSHVPPPAPGAPMLSFTEVPGNPQLQSPSLKGPLTAVRPMPTLAKTTSATPSAGSSVSLPVASSVGSSAIAPADEKLKEGLEKQKEVQSQDLMGRLKRDAEALAAMHKQQEGLLHALASQEKKQFEVMMEQRVQQEEFVLMRQFREQVMRLTQTAQARRAELEKKALEANLAWQQKKVEDVYLEKKSTMEQEYAKAQEQLTAKISKLNSNRSPQASLRQTSPVAVPTGGRPGSFVAAAPGSAVSALTATPPTAPASPLVPQRSSFGLPSTPTPVMFQTVASLHGGNAGSRQNSPAIKSPAMGLVARNLVAVPAMPSLSSKDD